MKISDCGGALLFRSSLPKGQEGAKPHRFLDRMWLICKSDAFVCCSRGLSLVLSVDFRSLFLFCL